MDDEVLIFVQASAPRRLTGVGVLGLLGASVIYLAVSQPHSDLGWQFFLMGLGASVLWLAQLMWLATQERLELTQTQLRTSGGTIIADVADIVSVDRGVLAFKPSNGFTLRLKTKTPRRWRPGILWCFGRNVGVGGVTNAGQTKAMAEIIATMIIKP